MGGRPPLFSAVRLVETNTRIRGSSALGSLLRRQLSHAAQDRRQLALLAEIADAEVFDFGGRLIQGVERFLLDSFEGLSHVQNPFLGIAGSTGK